MKKSSKKRRGNPQIAFRLTPRDKTRATKKAKRLGFESASEWMRKIVLEALAA